jgi:hypothetical protein
VSGPMVRVEAKLCIAAPETLGITSNRLNERPFFSSRRFPLRNETRYEVIYQWLRVEGLVRLVGNAIQDLQTKSGTEIKGSLVTVGFRRSYKVVDLRLVTTVERRVAAGTHRRRPSSPPVASAECYGLMQPIQSSYIECGRSDRTRQIESRAGRSVCGRRLLAQARRSGGRRHRSRTSETRL